MPRPRGLTQHFSRVRNAQNSSQRSVNLTTRRRSRRSAARLAGRTFGSTASLHWSANRATLTTRTRSPYKWTGESLDTSRGRTPRSMAGSWLLTVSLRAARALRAGGRAARPKTSGSFFNSRLRRQRFASDDGRLSSGDEATPARNTADRPGGITFRRWPRRAQSAAARSTPALEALPPISAGPLSSTSAENPAAPAAARSRQAAATRRKVAGSASPPPSTVWSYPSVKKAGSPGCWPRRTGP